MTHTAPINPKSGSMMIITGDTASALPLKKTIVQGQVIGPLVSLSVTQQFTNPNSGPVDLEYLFPLPENASIGDFELKVGGRIIKAKIQELEGARQAYEESAQKGQRAGLLEQVRPNLFSIQLANVAPGEDLQATLRYHDRLKFEDGTFEMVFPMGLTPRYQTPDHPEEAAGTSAPIALPGEEIGPVEIHLAVDAGAAIKDPTSPSHSLALTRLDARRFHLDLQGVNLPDHDFILRYALKDTNATANAWSSADPSGDYLLAVLFPPSLPEDFQAPPREFIFVLDRSGSMSGEPIGQARNAMRACLRALNPEDTFQILLFDDMQEWFRPEPSKVTQDEIDQADRFLGQVEGRGGTEILGALEAVFDRSSKGTRPTYIVFLTDGAVSAETRMTQLIRKWIGKGRMFTFGIGPSVNRALLNQMARLGHGTAEFLQLDEDIEGAIIRFQDRISFPVLTDLAMHWSGGRAWDIYPASLPDLYAGQPLEFSARVQLQKKGGLLSIRGLRDGKPVEMQMDLQPAKESEEAIQRVWSRARIDDLLDEMENNPNKLSQLRAEIISTALEARLATAFTSFVAIDPEVSASDGGQRKVIRIAQPLPKGLDRHGFIPTAWGGNLPPPSPAASQPYFNRMASKLSKRSTQDFTGSANYEVEPKPALVPGFASPLEGFKPNKTGGKPEYNLRWLARTQQVNGSWGGDVECTVAALLAFVRHGHTQATGSFRQNVRRAFEWLETNAGFGEATFIRALALAELAKASGQAGHIATANSAEKDLHKPANEVETIISSRLHENGEFSMGVPKEKDDLTKLRSAAIMQRPIDSPDELVKEPQAGLKRTWLAALI